MNYEIKNYDFIINSIFTNENGNDPQVNTKFRNSLFESYSLGVELNKICSVENCNRKRRTNGYCEFHYRQTNNYKKSKKKSDAKYYEKNKSILRKKQATYREKNRDGINAQKRNAWFKNHEENIKNQKERFANLTERQRIQYAITKKNYRQRNLEKTKEYVHNWHLKNRPRILSKLKQRYIERKTLVINHYSNGTMKCNNCGVKGLSFLTIDHLKPRKEMGHDRMLSSDRLITLLIDNNFPKGYQILCWNCNHIKEINIPKKLSDKKRNIQERERHKLLKIEVFTYYSKGKPMCNCCKYDNLDGLAIDHIEGRKKITHRKGLGGRELYAWIRRNKYPSNFQVLCFNCNGAKRDLMECPHQLE